MNIKIGFSPCPNDTFIFDALVNNRIDTGGIEFEPVMEDVQTLNEMAITGDLPLTKISYATLPMILERYVLLNTGSALGSGVGPLLIAPFDIPPAAVNHCVVAIPGKNTTANVLFSLAYPDAANKVFLRYDEIEDFVLGNTASLENIHGVKLGVIIHENRFTYAQKGLTKVCDLGNDWEQDTGLPIPLGGIVAQRTLPSELLTRIESLIRNSLDYSYAQGRRLSTFITENAKEMSAEVMWQHIGLYVNEYSRDLGETGKAAVRKFLQVHSAVNKINTGVLDPFRP